MYKPGQIITINLPHSNVRIRCRVCKNSRPGRKMYLIPTRIALKISHGCKLIEEKVFSERPIDL